MDELWRICKNGAKIKIIVPLFPGVYSMIDPTHKSFFTYMTFDYFKKTSSLKYYSKATFDILRKRIIFHPVLRFLEPLVNAHERVQKFYYIFLSGFIPPMFLHVDLRVVK